MGAEWRRAKGGGKWDIYNSINNKKEKNPKIIMNITQWYCKIKIQLRLVEFSVVTKDNSML